MNQTIKKIGKAAAGPGSGVVDSNRFYSMLLDARTTASVTVSESMYDIAEKLLKGEKENAKLALDQLWTLKKALSDSNTDSAVESLIAYYQDKIDVLREKEEDIKKVGKETRSLIDEKRKKNEELTIVKSQIGSHTRELRDLGTKLEVLKKREVELAVAEEHLKEEISINETQIVGGLYDIILRPPEKDEAECPPIGGGHNEAIELIKRAAAKIQKSAVAANTDANRLDELASIPENRAATVKKSGAPATSANAAAVSKQADVIHEQIVYPKSVVRMGGKIIGEYYHDGGNAVTKEERHYIYNSRFIAERMNVGLNAMQSKFSQDIYAELIKIAEDAVSRVNGNGRFHFEVSTNEILNDKNLRQLVADLRHKVWDDAERFSGRLNAKIEALGLNYEAMLQEQMERCSEMG